MPFFVVLKNVYFSLEVEIFYEQSDTWHDFDQSFMVNIVVLAKSFYCVLVFKMKPSEKKNHWNKRCDGISA